MTGKQLKAIGQRLHGHKWASGLAKSLRCHRSTIWRYAGMAKVPDDIAAALETPIMKRNR
jgi:hypothetical protein